MQKIPIIRVTEQINGEDIVINTIELIKIALNQKPPNGFSITDMHDRFRILNTIMHIPTDINIIHLEDADYSNLARYVRETRWGVLSKEIYNFINDFK